MISTITSFTQKILKEYPKAEGIFLWVDDATHNNMYDTWTADILEILVYYDAGANIIDAEEYYELFGNITYIKLGKNNKSRQIDSKHVFCVDIKTTLEKFTTKDGKTISYYPTSSEIITDKDHIAQLRGNAKTFTRDLINISKNKHRSPKLSDLPDFDSD